MSGDVNGRTCASKSTYATAAVAHRAAGRLLLLGRDPRPDALRVYCCRVCGLWHLGHLRLMEVYDDAA